MDYSEWKDEYWIDHRGLFITCTKYWDVVSNLGVSEDKGERRSYFGKFTVGKDAETGETRGEFEWDYFPFYADNVDPIMEALIKDKLMNTKIGEDTLAEYMIKEKYEKFSFVL